MTLILAKEIVEHYSQGEPPKDGYQKLFFYFYGRTISEPLVLDLPVNSPERTKLEKYADPNKIGTVYAYTKRKITVIME